ncbi:hypothetical protein ACHAXN_003329 [Cyclotella atomus]
MVRAIPVNKAPSAKAGATSPKRGRGRPPKNITAADGSAASSVDAAANPTPFMFPPPPPPPPPPVDNPYYQKFVEQYWQKYDGSYNTLPPMPSMETPIEPPMTLATSKATASPSKKSRETLIEIPHNLPPIPLAQEFPINTDRTTYFIGNPVEDADILSEKSCYIRSRLFELFLTLPLDPVHWKVKGTKNAENVVGRIGLRCVYCARLPPNSRAERNVTYPSSISRLYNTVADMQHKHLEQCESIPPPVRQMVHRLSNSASRSGNVAPKTYWEASAKEFGMEDIEGEKAGIRLIDEHKLIRKTFSAVETMFVPMGEEGKSSGVGVKKSEVTSDRDGEEGEKKVEKADEEVEEILAHL